MKKLYKFSIILLSILLIVPFNIPVNAQLNVSAEGAVLMDAATGEILYGYNEDKQLSMASTTKIMTSLLTIEYGQLDKVVTVTDKMVLVEGSSMGLRAGDKVSMEALVYGMLLSSGNDAANTAAITISGDADSFADLMNKRAKEIGADKTNFITASGLDDEHHYSTAYDMALIAREAMNNTVFAKISSQKTAKVSFGNPPTQYTLSNHNRLLKMYEGTIGVKTGYTKKSGRCLVSCVERDGVRLIAVTLDAPDDWNDHMAMYNYGFSLYGEKELDVSGINLNLPVIGGTLSSIDLVCAEPESVTLTNSQYERIERKIYLPKFLYAPLQVNQVIGSVDFCLDDQIISSCIITAQNNIVISKPKEEESFWDRLINMIFGE